MSTEPKKGEFEAVYKAKKTSGPTWAQMTPAEKAMQVGRICICIVSFGMIFPNAI